MADRARRVNREQLIDAVIDLSESVTEKAESDGLRCVDLLRLRAILMIIASAGWDGKTPPKSPLQVLPAAGDVEGAWPRLLGKAMSTRTSAGSRRRARRIQNALTATRPVAPSSRSKIRASLRAGAGGESRNASDAGSLTTTAHVDDRVRPGTASSLDPNEGMVQLWITSLEVMSTCTTLFTGTRISLSTARLRGTCQAGSDCSKN